LARPASRAAGSRGPNPALRLAAIRQWHTYIGVFIAPSVLFFAVTGCLQLFSLHEAHGNYTPPPLIEKLSAVHKDQRFSAKSDHDGPPAGAHHAHDAEADAGHDAPPKTPPIRTLALKCLFLAVGAGLIVSTCLGLYMALTTSRRKAVVWTLLILGAALPVLILAV